jgi:hypothetical protein
MEEPAPQIAMWKREVEQGPLQVSHFHQVPAVMCLLWQPGHHNQHKSPEGGTGHRGSASLEHLYLRSMEETPLHGFRAQMRLRGASYHPLSSKSLTGRENKNTSRPPWWLEPAPALHTVPKSQSLHPLPADWHPSHSLGTGQLQHPLTYAFSAASSTSSLRVGGSPEHPHMQPSASEWSPVA